MDIGAENNEVLNPNESKILKPYRLLSLRLALDIKGPLIYFYFNQYKEFKFSIHAFAKEV